MTVFDWYKGNFSNLTPTQNQKCWFYPPKTTHPTAGDNNEADDIKAESVQKTWTDSTLENLAEQLMDFCNMISLICRFFVEFNLYMCIYLD